MTDEHFDEAFERMQTELNVTPSPEFVVKVRQQNEQLQVRRGWNVWAWTGLAAACAAAVIAVALWPASAPEPQTQTVQNRPRESFSAVRQPEESFSPVQKPSPEAAPPTRAGRRGDQTLRTRSAAAPVIVAAAAATHFEVLVPPDQLIGIRQLMSSVRNGVGVKVAPAQPLIDPDTGELITPKPIEIPLISVTPLPGAPEGRGGGRENR